jgi:hypothetical protein
MVGKALTPALRATPLPTEGEGYPGTRMFPRPRTGEGVGG